MQRERGFHDLRLPRFEAYRSFMLVKAEFDDVSQPFLLAARLFLESS